MVVLLHSFVACGRDSCVCVCVSKLVIEGSSGIQSPDDHCVALSVFLYRILSNNNDDIDENEVRKKREEKKNDLNKKYFFTVCTVVND